MPQPKKHFDLRQLSYFKAIADTGTISAAAAKCGVSQPTISAQMASLEDHLQKTLLARSKKGVTLTDEGEILLKYTLRLLDEERLLMNEISKNNFEAEGEISFGASTDVSPFVVEYTLGEVIKNYPAMNIKYVEDSSANLTRAVAQREIDLAVISDSDTTTPFPPTLNKKTYYSEAFLLAVGTNHPFTNTHRHISLDDLKSENVIHYTERHCLHSNMKKLFGDHLKKSITVDQLSTGFGLVAKNLGVMIVPMISAQGFQRPDIIYRRFTDPVPQRNISFIHRKGERLPKSAKVLLKSLKTIPSFATPL